MTNIVISSALEVFVNYSVDIQYFQHPETAKNTVHQCGGGVGLVVSKHCDGGGILVISYHKSTHYDSSIIQAHLFEHCFNNQWS